MRKYILYIVIFLQIVLIISLIKGVQLSRKSASRIAIMEETRNKLQEESENLKNERIYVESEYYLEKVARDELHLSKPGETVVIVPNRIEVRSEKGEVKNEIQKTNWQKWWEVLSGGK